MEKKQSRLPARRRPPSMGLKLCEITENPNNRDFDDFGAIQPPMPIFASVHRPRQANISSIKKDEQSYFHRNQSNSFVMSQNNAHSQLQQQQQQCSQRNSAFHSMQSAPPPPPPSYSSSNNSSHDLIFTIDKITGDNGNTSIRGRMLNVVTSSKQSCQGIPYHQTIQPSAQSLAVSIPQPFNHFQKQRQQQNEQFPSQPSELQVFPPSNNYNVLQQYNNRLEGQHQQYQQQQHQQYQQQQHQQYEQQQKLKYQQQSQIPESVHGRTIIGGQKQHQPQQNFNQISKTATNLLHDIYEKHLLNLTTFENASILNRKVMKSAGYNVNTSITNGCSIIGCGDIINNGANMDGNFNLNNVQLHQKLHQQQQQQQISFIKGRRHYQNQPFLPPSNPPNVTNNCNSSSLSNSLLQSQKFDVLHVQQQQEPIQHLYETVNDSVIPVACSNNTPGIIPNTMQSTSNRIPKKRLPVKVQRNNKNSILVDNKQSNSSNQRKQMSGGNDENYFGASILNHQEQNQQPQFHHHLSITTPLQTYNYQQRTKADGENQPNTISNAIENGIVGCCASVSNNGGNSGVCGVECENIITGEKLHSLQSTSNSQNSSEFISSSSSENKTKNNCILTANSMQNIRSAPIGGSVLPPSGVLKTTNEDETCKTAIGHLNDNINCVEQQLSECNESGVAGQEIEEGVTKVQYRNSKIDLMLETAQAVAAAAYYAKAAQKLAQGGSSKSRSTDMPANSTRNGGFCGALQRAPPTMPGGLARRLANKENYGIGRVKVMLRVSDSYNDEETPHFMAFDKKKRQVTLTDSAACTIMPSTSTQERGPMVSAPKMFAFDGLFTVEDQQHDICASALSEVIPAVLEGSDGCLLSLGYPNSGQSRTMLGSVNSSNELGAIPCAISWLYKGINERRQKSGARFSVRVSALGVSATKPDSSSKDLLAAHATDSDDSPGVYLRDDFLGGPTELRAPTAERAALFLDAALAGRPKSGLEPAMIFTLHVYQYSLSGKGGVAGGRSRLHLIDLGGCANRNGGLSLSGIGNILLAILSGQRHPPNKDHPLTPLLKDCLAPLTCHVTILAHVSHLQTHADALTTIQLASRIHRMRRRKHRFPISSDKALGANNAGHQSGGSSEGPDPSSSDLSADTVIYMGPCDDATDGEHPPVYLPSLSSGDNRCAMNKVLKGTPAEKSVKTPVKKNSNKPQSPVITHRTDSLKRSNVPSSSPTPPPSNDISMLNQTYSPAHSSSKMHSANTSPKIVAGTLRHSGTPKGSNISTPKGSPLRRTNMSNSESPVRHISEEQWVDGPRVSRSKVAEARHLLREINHVKKCETWIDGPKSIQSKPLTVGNLPLNGATNGYGFMDSHKKTMIRQWVENQSSHVFQSKSSSPNHQNQQQQQQQLLQQQLRTMTYHLTQFNKQKSEDDQHSVSGSNTETNMNTFASSLPNNSDFLIKDNFVNIQNEETDMNNCEKSMILQAHSQSCHDIQNAQDEEDQDSGPSEVPPALPLIEPLGSREISHESLHRIISRHVSRESLAMSQQNVQTIDCGLQVTEEEIARTMGSDHPLAALSHGDFSIVSSFNIGDAFSDCAMGERTRSQFDQLARLREIFTSQLAMAEVTPVCRVRDVSSVYSEPAFRFNTGAGSVCSEPAYRPPSPRCRSCRQSLNASHHSSETSLPSLNGIMAIAGMEQYASLRHPDGASDPNLQQKHEKHTTRNDDDQINEKTELLMKENYPIETTEKSLLTKTTAGTNIPIVSQSQLPLLPLNSSEAYDSGHDSSTPRTSKHSGISSRRAESGYHSVGTVRDSDESSFTSAGSKQHNRITMKKKRQDKSLCNWLRNPFTCTYPETEGEISDF